jgi:D-arabinose 1-dehydrogenase-like Zn-dependent alcohol dehydrogenase
MLSHTFFTLHCLQKNLKSLCQLLKWNKIKPNITSRVGLSEVADAQTKLENGELHGTIVCLPWKSIDGK